MIPFKYMYLFILLVYLKAQQHISCHTALIKSLIQKLNVWDLGTPTRTNAKLFIGCCGHTKKRYQKWVKK